MIPHNASAWVVTPTCDTLRTPSVTPVSDTLAHIDAPTVICLICISFLHGVLYDIHCILYRKCYVSEVCRITLQSTASLARRWTTRSSATWFLRPALAESTGKCCTSLPGHHNWNILVWRKRNGCFATILRTARTLHSRTCRLHVPNDMRTDGLFHARFPIWALCLVVCGVSFFSIFKNESVLAPIHAHTLCWAARWTIVNSHACVHSISYVRASWRGGRWTFRFLVC
jgi:hypothetical protein